MAFKVRPRSLMNVGVHQQPVERKEEWSHIIRAAIFNIFSISVDL